MSKTRRSKSVTSRDRGRVLLVTEDPNNVPTNLFEASGLEVVGVSTGAAALVSLQRSRPHLVIADSAVEGITARELGRMLANGGEGLPLILVGRETSTNERRLIALSLGAFDYFQMPEEAELMVVRAAQLVSLQQTLERLRTEADLDFLTGLPNRRRFRAALANEVERWRRYGLPCALLLLDIDHMKGINDRFGHPAGDLVIRHVANVLSEVSRDNDTPARLGGEEFALLLTTINDEKAAQAAERLRQALADHSIPNVGQITVSIGVAACPAHATSERMLYSASDRALYVAKNEGRNRIAVAPLLQEKLPGV
ncbi:MAG TPA: diguanylate cyclase [Pyrinomonadaceae bacterium]|jgi:diguanylate cyclase (GGDEF)-like protein